MAVADILMGPVTVYYAPVGEALPDETSVEYGDPWGGNWTALGYTKGNLSCNYEFDVVEATIEQALGPVKRRKKSETVALETVLAEFTGDNLALVTNGTKTHTAAGVGQVEYDDVDVGGDPSLTERAWGFEGEYVDDSGTSFPMRVFVYKGTAKLGGALEFGKEVEGVGLTLHVDALEDMSKSAGQRLIKFQKVTAAATS